MSKNIQMQYLGNKLPILFGWQLIVLIGWAIIISFSSNIYAQDPEFTPDFETGDLRGWQARGDAFNRQPTLGDNPTARNRGQPSNHQGEWWIGTFERYQGRARDLAGSTQGDRPQGTLQSSEFTVPSGSLTFLIGGGESFETRVELIVLNVGGDPEFNQNRVYHASGKNTETMQRVTWNLTEYAGRQGFIRIVDASSGGWGHINADDFRFIPRLQVARPDNKFEIPPGTMAPVEPRPTLVPDLRGRNLEQAEEILMESGLQIGNIQPIVPGYMEGPVIRQRPEPGAEAARGSRVNLVLGGPRQVEVPNVIGRTTEVASRILMRNDLSPGTRREQVSPEHLAGSVIGQDPPPGTEVIVGSPVNLVVAVAPEVVLVTVPDLTGLTPQEAEPALRELRIALGNAETMQSEREENTIIRQVPRAGRQVEAGTLVNVVVSERLQVVVPPPPVVDVPPVLDVPVPVARPYDVFWLLNSAIVLIVVVGGVLLFWKRPGRGRHGEHKAPQAELEITPRPDQGTVSMENDQPLDQDFELRLRAVGDPGVQSVEPRDGLTQQESENHE